MVKKSSYLGGHTTFRVGDPSWGKVDDRPKEREVRPPPRTAQEEQAFREFTKFEPKTTLLPRKSGAEVRAELERAIEEGNARSKGKRKGGKQSLDAQKRSALKLLMKQKGRSP